jgi:peptide deformylase
MAVLPVFIYPHPMLKQKLTETDPDLASLKSVFGDLVETLRHHPGCVGLAAPQIGHTLRALVVDVSCSPRAEENHGLLHLVNPHILEASQWKISREGCLSFPDLLANVKRAQKIRLEAHTEKWEKIVLNCRGFEAVALQHELDHLDGILFLDRIRSSKDLFERRKTSS